MVYRVFVEKKKESAREAEKLLYDIRNFLGVDSLRGLRLINRYDAEGISPELFDYAVKTVFSDPPSDITVRELENDGAEVFAVEYLPGQFDQRADSAAQCVQIISRGARPVVRTAKIYMLYGNITPDDLAKIKKYIINPIEAREASMEKPETLEIRRESPKKTEILNGFRSLDRKGLENLVEKYGLAMDLDDAEFCREYFRSEKRDPSIAEIKTIDAYWSDHCRHTTFNAEIDDASFEDPEIEKTYLDYLETRKRLGVKKPASLMDLATVAAKRLKKEGKLSKLDESEEINACTVKINVEIDGEERPWLLLFKNETHNHPTEIEPFGGAATCIGGAIRDPLSGRAYVYGAARLTGAADPLRPLGETLPGKLPQRKIVTAAAAGYSSYGNQVGLATGIVDELYHPGYAAKHMEIGAVIAAAPAENVRRERPRPGDAIILFGGRTGRDGCGGATGSSKAHTVKSLESCGAEVQKGNAPEERKLQRFFRNKEVCGMVKRCNDFGAGGVVVAVGELADGLDVDLNAVSKKYEGLDGVELAISESQERMAAVVDAGDAERFIALAENENLEAAVVAAVTAEPRLTTRWNGEKIVDISREFLNTNGVKKHARARVRKASPFGKAVPASFADGYRELAGDLNVCSKRGLAERFDSTIGAGAVLAPFGGKNQLTPVQALVQKIPVEKKHTMDCSLMAWGFNPYISEKDPYRGAYLAVVESVCKLAATGAGLNDVYLTFQEYFERLNGDPERWGKPLAALLGAYKAQTELGIGAIGGKDSMSGSFEDLDVPPTLVSFAVSVDKVQNIVPNHLKSAGNKLVLIKPDRDENGLPDSKSLLEVLGTVRSLLRSGKAVSAYSPGYGGIAEAVMKTAFGEFLGFRFEDGVSLDEIFGYNYGSFLLELKPEFNEGELLGYVTEKSEIRRGNESLDLSELLRIYEDKLESVYACNAPSGGENPEPLTYNCKNRPFPAVRSARPSVLIPAFPGTNCEYDAAKAVEDAGAKAEIFVVNNLTPAGISRSADGFARALSKSQILFIPGGFSGGDEPDGSGKFIAAFFRNAAARDGVQNLLNERGGLICGVCNGFQALIRLGLVPYGKIIDADEDRPSLTFNAIGRHQSRIARVRVASDKSPWLALTRTGEIYNTPVSHGEGRFLASPELMKALAENGQIATQYVDLDGRPTMDVRFNPNGSVGAVEGICSPDGRVFGKMGHAERAGRGLYKNVPGNYDMKMFAAAVKYFQ